MKTAVETIFVGKAVSTIDALPQMCSIYGRSVAARGVGGEGQVENRSGGPRIGSYTPRLRLKTLNE